MRIAIIDGIRSAFCKMNGPFKDTSAQELARITARELIDRLRLDPQNVDEVVFGNVSQPPEAANIARVIALLTGIPVTRPAFTVHRNCASGMEAVVTGAMRINAGEAACVLAGGTESMSNIPLFASRDLQDILFQLNRAKSLPQKLAALGRLRPRHLSPRVGLQLGLTDPVCGLNMGQTAEVLAKEFGISRHDQDGFALESHMRVARGRDALREEIVPVIPGPKYKQGVEDDVGPRENQTIEALAKLKPVFDRYGGTVTAGNASQITDGAVSLLLMSEQRAEQLGLEPLGYLRAFAVAGVEPHRMGIGPAHAIPRALKRADLTVKDVDVWEINEAFAAQVLACLSALESKAFAEEFGYTGHAGKIPRDRLNVNGGAIALGHPVGATGARMILTLLRQMRRTGKGTGVAALCIGGGQGMAVVLER